MSKVLWSRLAIFGMLGLLIHALGISTFIVVSKSAAGLAWKLLIIGGTGIACVVLLWFAMKQRKSLMSAIICSAVLAVGFELAFHLVGLLGFRGLLEEANSVSYFLSLLQAVGVIFIIYLLPAVLIHWIMTFQTPHTSV